LTSGGGSAGGSLALARMKSGNVAWLSAKPQPANISAALAVNAAMARFIRPACLSRVR
jgi:hypothetical protein